MLARDRVSIAEGGTLASPGRSRLAFVGFAVIAPHITTEDVALCVSLRLLERRAATSSRLPVTITLPIRLNA